MKSKRLKCFVVFLILIVPLTGYAKENVDTSFFKLNLVVDNAYIRQHSSVDFDFFSNVFSMGLTKYEAGGFLYCGRQSM